MRIEALTFFRFVAAAIVVHFHFGAHATGVGGVLSAGPEMVTFFFVLSGFVMGISYLPKALDKRSYWRARFARIMPLYLLAMALAMISNPLLGKENDPVAITLNALLLQSWISPYPLRFNYPAWSLSVEAFFYLAFPFIWHLVRTRNPSAGITLLAALVLWAGTQATLTLLMLGQPFEGFLYSSSTFTHYFPLAHLCSFVLGIAGAIAATQYASWMKGSLTALALAVVSFLLIACLLSNQDMVLFITGAEIPYGASFWAPLFTLFIVAISACPDWATQPLRWWPLVLLGEASYAFYILQEPVHNLFDLYLSGLLGPSPVLNFYLFAALLLAASVFCFLFIERPAMNFIKGFKPEWRIRATA